MNGYQLRTIHLPPAVQILAVLLLGILAGMLGILVATPLVITLIVLVRALRRRHPRRPLGARLR